MRITKLVVVASLVVFAVPSVLGQSASSKPATYITKEEIDIVNKQPGGDRQIKVVDIGHENFAIGIVHRGATGAARERWRWRRSRARKHAARRNRAARRARHRLLPARRTV